MSRLSCFLLLTFLLNIVGIRDAGAQDAIPSPVRHIYLIQNSGWMLAYVTDRNARYREFLNAFINATAPLGTPTIIADFSTASQVKDGASPGILGAGEAGPQFIQEAINRLKPPPLIQGSQTELVDSDYSEALRRTTERADLAAGQPAVIWMITNNMYAPSSTQGKLNDNVKNLTEAFNKTLSSDNNIVLLFAIIKQLRAAKPPDRGPEFEGRGLVVYGMAYGPTAATPLLASAMETERRSLFDTRPARLKPLAISPLTYIPTAILTDGIDVSYDERGRLVLSNVPTGEPITIRIEGTLSSNYFPQVIDSAAVRMSWESVQGIENVQGFVASLSRQRLERLRPSDKLEKVELTLQLPAIDRPVGLAGLTAEETRVDGVIKFSIHDVRLELDDDFNLRMKDIFAADRWRGVFLDGFRVTDAVTELPIVLVVPHSQWPLMGGVLGLLLAIAATLAAIWLATRERRFPIQMPGETRMISIKPFRTISLRGKDGKSLMEARGRMFGPPSTRPLAPPQVASAKPPSPTTRIPRR